MADENSRFLHRHMYFPEYCRDLPSSTLNVRLMYTLFHKVTNQGCRYVLVMQQATPQDAHRTQKVGVCCQFTCSTKQASPSKGEATILPGTSCMVKGGLAVDGKVYSWHIQMHHGIDKYTLRFDMQCFT